MPSLWRRLAERRAESMRVLLLQDLELRIYGSGFRI